MNITIIAEKDFQGFLKQYESQISILSLQEVPIEKVYDADFFRKNNIVKTIAFNVVLNVASGFIHDAIQQYINQTHSPVIITTESNRKTINYENINDEKTIKYFDKINAIIEDEKCGKKCQ